MPHLYCARIGTHLNKKKHKPKEKGATSKLTNPFFSLRSYGAEGQNRTADTGIFSPLLYRLSYLGIPESKNCF